MSTREQRAAILMVGVETVQVWRICAGGSMSLSINRVYEEELRTVRMLSRPSSDAMVYSTSDGGDHDSEASRTVKKQHSTPHFVCSTRDVTR